MIVKRKQLGSLWWGKLPSWITWFIPWPCLYLHTSPDIDKKYGQLRSTKNSLRSIRSATSVVWHVFFNNYTHGVWVWVDQSRIRGWLVNNVIFDSVWHRDLINWVLRKMNSLMPTKHIGMKNKHALKISSKKNCISTF